jgi:hypothetical protein
MGNTHYDATRQIPIDHKQARCGRQKRIHESFRRRDPAKLISIGPATSECFVIVRRCHRSHDPVELVLFDRLQTAKGFLRAIGKGAFHSADRIVIHMNEQSVAPFRLSLVQSFQAKLQERQRLRITSGSITQPFVQELFGFGMDLELQTSRDRRLANHLPDLQRIRRKQMIQPVSLA